MGSDTNWTASWSPEIYGKGHMKLLRKWFLHHYIIVWTATFVCRPQQNVREWTCLHNGMKKVYLCTRIWWKAPNEHNCAPKCTVNEPKCVMAVIGVPRLGLGSLPASTPPATLGSSRPPRLRDATTVMFESPFSPQSLCTRLISP